MTTAGEQIESTSPPLSESAINEKLLVGVLLQLATFQPEALSEAVQIVHPSDFQVRKNTQVVTAMMELDIEEKPYGVVEVYSRMGGGGETVQYLMDCEGFSRNYGHTFMVTDYAHKVREASERRRLIKAAEQIKALAMSGDYGTNRELFDKAESMLSAVEPLELTPTGPVPVTDKLSKYLDDLTERYQQAKNGEMPPMGLMTGLTDLDLLWTGLKPRKYYVFAARPAMGKTAFLLHILMSVVEQYDDVYAVMFSAEMAFDDEMINRMIANRGRIDQGKLQTAMLDEHDWGRVSGAVGRLNPRLMIDDTEGMTMTHIRREARKIRRQIGKDKKLIIAVDYLQLIEGPKQINDDEYRLNSYLSKQLNKMKKSLDATIIALSQLNRDLEKRADKRPGPSDIRGSGQIEQDADLIAFLYRDEVYNPDTDEKNVLEVITSKQRAGKIGVRKLIFAKEFGRIESFALGA
ncbi:hypothetical protein CIG75_19205 [Tumebacillus algifaecis]|uniref:SF4 helicase domain-containing protein n=1 Tax=Tumebacillus algifaecis TaxID=1214604 RepID=A0A223D5J3_9BACL|nr:DnaB-like helicase C-terminal domain-containing protein [Tumebacillus algifaecis]ASS76862.1 hypothetical protein CIG75_19205 [Tumebacillus algifaecis]